MFFFCPQKPRFIFTEWQWLAAVQDNIEYHAVECAYVPKFGFGEKESDMKPDIKP
jgi:hypothetical protein